jgi:hypothetical protein
MQQMDTNHQNWRPYIVLKVAISNLYTSLHEYIYAHIYGDIEVTNTMKTSVMELELRTRTR